MIIGAQENFLWPGTVVICNHVLLSIVWFFIMVGATSIRSVEGWGGVSLISPGHAGKKILHEKNIWWLGLVDLEAAKTSLLGKWIVKALTLDESNLQFIHRCRLARVNLQ